MAVLDAPNPRVTRSRDLLQEQIDTERATIRTDSFSTSVGELASMYKDRELDIHPEFQRFYRWDDDRKSKFIESLLLGIPIPSLFVAQQPDGVWEVVDGLQRLATIFEFMGILVDENGDQLPPSTLTATRYLPALEGMKWESEDGLQLSPSQRLYLKRSKLDVKIILRESTAGTKFELFQRLNTGGAELSDQEIRNAMLVAANPAFYRWLKELSEFRPFVDCTALSERLVQERFSMELVLRFVVFRRLENESLSNIGDLGDFLTDQMTELSDRFDKIRNAEASAFKHTFELLEQTVGIDAFRKYDSSRKKPTGGFSISAFETVALGLGFNADLVKVLSKKSILDKIATIWQDRSFLANSGSGVRASSRIPKTLPLGRRVFAP